MSNSIKVAYIEGMVRQFFGGNQKKTKTWMETKSPHFGDLSPKELIALGKESKVEEFLSKAKENN